MAKYEISIKQSAEKELQHIPKRDLPRVIRHMIALSDEPRPRGCEKLSGQERYRIRQGDYRIVYTVDDKEKKDIVFKIGYRREIYK